MPYEERNTLMSNKFNELIELFIAEEQDKAKELFHQICVEKSRDIYESLLDEEEIEETDKHKILLMILMLTKKVLTLQKKKMQTKIWKTV
jgi:hypothetical protein